MKKKHLTYAGIIAALILVGMFIGICLSSSPFPLPGPSTTFDPITDANVDGNNIMSMTGTTTLPTDSTNFLITVTASSPSVSQGNATEAPETRGNAFFIADAGGNHRWKGIVNISALQPGDYTIALSTVTVDENFKLNISLPVATQHFTLGDENTGAGSIHKKIPTAPQPFIRINPADQKPTAGNLKITGITNLEPGTALAWSMRTVSGSTGNNTQELQGTATVTPGIDRVNRWSVLPGADSLKPARYQFGISANPTGNTSPAGTIAAISEFDIPLNHTGKQNTTRTTQAPPGFITIDTLPDIQVNNAYIITGTTSLPQGDHIMVTVYPASFETGFDFSLDARDTTQNRSLSSGAVFWELSGQSML